MANFGSIYASCWETVYTQPAVVYVCLGFHLNHYMKWRAPENFGTCRLLCSFFCMQCKYIVKWSSISFRHLLLLLISLDNCETASQSACWVSGSQTESTAWCMRSSPVRSLEKGQSSRSEEDAAATKGDIWQNFTSKPYNMETNMEPSLLVMYSLIALSDTSNLLSIIDSIIVSIVCTI